MSEKAMSVNHCEARDAISDVDRAVGGRLRTEESLIELTTIKREFGAYRLACALHRNRMPNGQRLLSASARRDPKW